MELSRLEKLKILKEEIHRLEATSPTDPTMRGLKVAVLEDAIMEIESDIEHELKQTYLRDLLNPNRIADKIILEESNESET